MTTRLNIQLQKILRMKKISLPILLLLGTLLMMTSCERDEGHGIIVCSFGEITTVQYTLIPTSGGAPIVLKYIDSDGGGGNDPIITQGVLKANEIYTGELELLDESQATTDNVSVEVTSEAQYYQFFFESTLEGIAVTYEDQDLDGNPLGIQNRLSTENEGTGTLRIILLQEPNKNADGVADGEIDNADGEVDIELAFPIIVE
jgi:hypothetical protein